MAIPGGGPYAERIRRDGPARRMRKACRAKWPDGGTARFVAGDDFHVRPDDGRMRHADRVGDEAEWRAECGGGHHRRDVDGRDAVRSPRGSMTGGHHCPRRNGTASNRKATYRTCPSRPRRVGWSRASPTMAGARAAISTWPARPTGARAAGIGRRAGWTSCGADGPTCATWATAIGAPPPMADHTGKHVAVDDGHQDTIGPRTPDNRSQGAGTSRPHHWKRGK